MPLLLNLWSRYPFLNHIDSQAYKNLAEKILVLACGNTDILDVMTVITKTGRCIVLDLDLTLVSTSKVDGTTETLVDLLSDPRTLPIRDRIYYFNMENYQAPGIGTKVIVWGVARPHFREFLSFCNQHFERVVVWSAGKRVYVEEIVDFLFRDLRRPEIVYNYDMLDKDRGMVKTLSTILKEDHLVHIDLSKTLALDDNHSTFEDNPSNGILIPEYKPHVSAEGFLADDTALTKLQDWLTSPEVLSATDVRLLSKHHIFTTA